MFGHLFLACLFASFVISCLVVVNSVCQSIYLFVCLCVFCLLFFPCLFAYSFSYLLIHLFTCLLVYLSVRLLDCLSIYVFIWLLVYLFTNLFFLVSLFDSLHGCFCFLCLFICLLYCTYFYFNYSFILIIKALEDKCLAFMLPVKKKLS